MSTSNICNEVEELANYIPYRIVILFKSGLMLAGIILVIYEFFTKCHSLKIALHVNASLICNFIRVFLIWMCGGYLTIYCYDFLRLTKPVLSPCERLAPSLLVICLRIFVTIPSNALIICFYVVAIERLLCTVFLVNYEKSSYPKLITFVIIISTIAFSCVGVYLLFGKADFNDLLVYSASRNSGNAAGYTIWVYTFLIAEFLLIFVFIIIRLWNAYLFQKVRRKHLTANEQRNLLSMKFQINETIKIMDTFLPIVIGLFLAYVFTSGGVLIIPTIFKDSPRLLISTMNEVVILHFLTAHIFALVRLYKVNKLCCQNTNWSTIETIKAEETNEKYYERQQAMFGAKIPPTKV